MYADVCRRAPVPQRVCTGPCVSTGGEGEGSGRCENAAHKGKKGRLISVLNGHRQKMMSENASEGSSYDMNTAWCTAWARSHGWCKAERMH